MATQSSSGSGSGSGSGGGSGSGKERSSKDAHIKVVVRVRPSIEEDLQDASKCGFEFEDCTHTEDSNTIAITKPYYDAREFRFDAVLSQQALQEDVYEVTAQPIVREVLDGFHGTVICYGQTGTGKTYTVFGGADFWQEDPALASNMISDTECGIVPRAVFDLFDAKKTREAAGTRVSISMSFLQIYMEVITDLLDGSGVSWDDDYVPTSLQVREDKKTGVFVEGLREVKVHSVTDVLRTIRFGAAQRATGTTCQNASSSRSHAMLLFNVEQWSEAAAEDGTAEVKRSTLRFVDLAGSERVSKSGSEGMRLEEAKKINKSISALGNCVAALAKAAGKGSKARHVPFRDSKLTRMLTDSLGGNTKTLLCANIGPSSEHYDETFTTLLFASRAMSVRNKPRINRSRSKKYSTPSPLAVADMSDDAENDDVMAATPSDEDVSGLQDTNRRLEQENELLRELLRNQAAVAAPSSGLGMLAGGSKSSSKKPAPSGQHGHNQLLSEAGGAPQILAKLQQRQAARQQAQQQQQQQQQQSSQQAYTIASSASQSGHGGERRAASAAHRSLIGGNSVPPSHQNDSASAMSSSTRSGGAGLGAGAGASAGPHHHHVLKQRVAWQQRETHLVTKFTGIINSLQQELKRQSYYIDEMQASKVAAATTPRTSMAMSPAKLQTAQIPSAFFKSSAIGTDALSNSVASATPGMQRSLIGGKENFVRPTAATATPKMSAAAALLATSSRRSNTNHSRRAVHHHRR